ncbi:LPXTG-motif cell wall anchor domain-containing protein [Streptococcus pyogenes]|uniref:DUF1542 domain-containing protein n=4 Tax=Streptococcus pyogenes TaxID=1314 RepID=UPI0010A1059B|nr:DUF1542 domain-containing protein [Streptococcus pyogenes]VHB97962.1 LPXTG-motif cell wall anchor domain-containing protein [Streptococcus pyogenes]
MFLKHQDVKQKNWRMRKVKKVFVSSCMLLTVGLGVAVPTGFSQSNGVMVVKAAEVPQIEEQDGSPKELFQVEKSGGFYLTRDASKGIGRYFAHGSNSYGQSGNAFLAADVEVSHVSRRNQWVNHYEQKRDKDGYNGDSSFWAGKDGTLGMKLNEFRQQGQRANSVALRVNTKDKVVAGHTYRVTFDEKKVTNNIQTAYFISATFNGNKDAISGDLRTTQQNKVSKIDIVDETGTKINQLYQKRKPGLRIITFQSKVNEQLSLTLIGSVPNIARRNGEAFFANFKMIDITKPAVVDENGSVAYAGDKKVTLKLKGQDDRTNFKGEKIDVYRNNERIGTATVSTNSSNLDITLNEGALPLKKDEKLTFGITQTDSKKTHILPDVITVGVKPEVERVQKAKILELNQIRDKTQKLIKEDPWLSDIADSRNTAQDTNKEIQLNKLEENYKKVKQAIENAITEQDVTKAFEEYTSQDSKYPNSLPNQHKKGDSIAENNRVIEELNRALTKTKNRIKEDPWLTAQEQQLQTEAAQNAFETGKKELKKADTLEKLNKERDRFIKDETDLSADKRVSLESIPNAYMGSDNNKKKAQNKVEQIIKDENVKAKENILKDISLTKLQQEKELEKLEDKVRIAIAEVQNAKGLSDLNKVEDRVSSGDFVHETGTPLPEQINDAIKKLEDYQKEIEANIGGDKTLPRSDKDSQLNASKEALKQTIANLKKANDADNVAQLLESGKTAVNTHKPGEDLQDQIAKALKKLEKEKNNTSKIIEADKSLTKEAKEAQLKILEEKFEFAEDAVSKASDAEGVEVGLNKGLLDIPTAHKEGVPLEEQSNSANKELEELQKEIEKKIKANPNTTSKEKQQQLKNLSDKFNKGIGAIASAVDADGIKEVLEKGKKEILEVFEEGTPLKEQQDKAIKDLEAIKNETLKAIAEDPTLINDKKIEQEEAAKRAFDVESDKLAKTTDADQLNKQFEMSKSSVQGTHESDKSLSEQKKQATAVLQAKQQKIEKAIKAEKALTTAEKDKQVKDSKEALAKALENVKQAKDADNVNVAKQDGIQAIEAVYQPGKLDDVQTKATAELQKVHDETVAKINGDDTLDKATKEAQVKEADKALAAGKAAITKADDADKVGAAVTEHTPKIKAAHKTGDLKKSQEEANTALDKAAEKERGEINKDATLTTEDKAKQLKEVETALTKAKAKVAEAKAADAINDTRDKGVATIDAVHKAGQDLGARKSGQVAKLEEAAKATKDKISADPTLISKEKEEQSKAVDAELKKAIEAVNAADTADKVDDALGKGVIDIKNQHKTGDPVEARREAHGKELDRVAQETKGAIEKDPTLTTEEKAKQVKDVDAAKERGMAKLNEAKNADELDKAYGEGVTDIKNQHKSGDPIEARRGLHNKSIDEVAQATKDAITADTTLTEAEKETQRGNVDKEATKAKEELAKAKDADALDKAYGDGVTSIKNQHKSGKGLDVRKDEHKKALEAVAKRVTAEIEADPTLTPEVREQQKAEVQKELELATDKIAEAKDADEADKAYGDGVTAIENAHVIGKGIEARKDLAKKDLAEAVAKTKALIIEDKTLTDDQRKEQLLGVDTEYAKGIENIDAAKDAAGVDKAYSDGVRDILAQYKEGQNLNDRRNAAKEFLLKEADKVTKLINDDPTLAHDQKVDQINKVEQAKLDAIKSVDDAQTADAINDALGKGIENINNQYQHGDGVDVRKVTAKGDLEKEAAKVKALIAKDPTLTQADKDKQTAAVDAAKNTAIAAVDKATTADGVNQELGKGITAINKAYRPGEGVKARKEAAKADLEKEAAKVKALIAKDPTLTQADKAKQTEAVAKALKAAIAAVDKATTAEGINQELGKGITAINKAYRPGEGVKARKEAAKANLEKVAKETKALISGDRYLSETEKAVQKQAVEQALAKALGQVEAAKTVEAVKLAENLGTVAIRSAYVAGLAKDTDQATAALNEAKQAAIEALKQAAAETLAKITTDAKLTEAQKAEQSENVSLALKTAIATVRSAQSIASVKEAKDKGITAIRAAYVPNKAVAKSSSANHLPKSGDANSIVLVGLGVMSLLLGMVLYSKKKESKD